MICSREELIKSFNKLRINDNPLISFVVNCMNAEGSARAVAESLLKALLSAGRA